MMFFENKLFGPKNGHESYGHEPAAPPLTFWPRWGPRFTNQVGPPLETNQIQNLFLSLEKSGAKVGGYQILENS